MATGLAISALASAAWASTPSSVTVTGPRKVQSGATVKLHFTGVAASGVYRLRVWLDDQRCSALASGEGTRPGLVYKSFHVQGSFRAVLTVQHSSSGTHYVCAYLIQQSTQGTAARGTLRYTTS